MRWRAGWFLVVITPLVLGGCKKRESVELVCGGLLNSRCPTSMYCELKEGCGGFDREGVCKPRPMKCPEEREVVCGCDGENHEGRCFAALKGVTVRHVGECEGSERRSEPDDAEQESEEGGEEVEQTPDLE